MVDNKTIIQKYNLCDNFDILLRSKRGNNVEGGYMQSNILDCF